MIFFFRKAIVFLFGFQKIWKQIDWEFGISDTSPVFFFPFDLSMVTHSAETSSFIRSSGTMMNVIIFSHWRLLLRYKKKKNRQNSITQTRLQLAQNLSSNCVTCVLSSCLQMLNSLFIIIWLNPTPPDIRLRSLLTLKKKKYLTYSTRTAARHQELLCRFASKFPCIRLLDSPSVPTSVRLRSARLTPTLSWRPSHLSTPGKRLEHTKEGDQYIVLKKK